MNPARNLISSGVNARYIDAHCHLQFEQYENDRKDIIEEMRTKGIVGIVVGCDLETSQQAVALAEEHEHLYASVGLHPSNIGQHFDSDAFRKIAKHPKVVAIGECGLDYFRLADDETKHVQQEIFKKHTALASELDKPLIIHARSSKRTMDAYHDLGELLRESKVEYQNLRGDIHFFAGGISEADSFIGINFTISFTAVITFARDYDAVIRDTPLTHILSETDAPYLAPENRRGQRNDPMSVVAVVAKIAEIRGEDPETVRYNLFANALRVFAISDICI